MVKIYKKYNIKKDNFKIECKFGHFCQRPNCSYTHPHRNAAPAFYPFQPAYPMMGGGFYPKNFKKPTKFIKV